jgi:hypothetical protein
MEAGGLMTYAPSPRRKAAPSDQPPPQSHLPDCHLPLQIHSPSQSRHSCLHCRRDGSAMHDISLLVLMPLMMYIDMLGVDGA